MDNENIFLDLMSEAGNLAQGDLANYFMTNGLNAQDMRPFIGGDNKYYVTAYKGGCPTKKESYTNKLVVNATLRWDEWRHLDEAVLKIADQRLTGINDLIANGLVYNLPNAMGTMQLVSQDMSDAMEAVITMDGTTRSTGDRPVFSTNLLPIPIIHSDYEVNLRSLEASRRMQTPIDSLYAERAARKVTEKLEEMLFTDISLQFGGGVIHSYVNTPDRNTATLTAAWDSEAATPAGILSDVISFKQASIDSRHYGPWAIYIPTAYETVMDGDFDETTPGTTIRERLLKVDGIKGIKVVDKLPDDTVLLVQMTSDVVRLVQGLGIQNVEWATEGKFIHKHKVICIAVPQIRSDFEGRSGIVHASVAA